MQIGTAVAIFFLIWWVVLFAVLPWGVRSQHEAGEVVPGTDPGAPMVFHLRRKLLWTTLVSVAVFAVVYLIDATGLVTIQSLTRPLSLP